MALYCQGASASAASLSCKPVLFPSCTSCSYSLCSSSFEAICSLFQESLSCCTFWSDDISPKEKEKERRGEGEKESRSIQAYTRSLPVFICHGRLHFVFFLFLHCCYQMALFFFLVRRAFSLSDLRHGTKNEENEKNTDLFFFSRGISFQILDCGIDLFTRSCSIKNACTASSISAVCLLLLMIASFPVLLFQLLFFRGKG